MKPRIVAACTAFWIGASAWMPGAPAAQATTFPTIQPYMTDYKIGFTDGAKLVTRPVYDEFWRFGSYTMVTKAGKKGLLDNKTGKEITPAIWDNIEVPDPNKIAIVQNGGWFQYLDMTTGKLSKDKFSSGYSLSLSPEHPTVIMMIGQTSMLLDPSGKVLIPPFAGKLSWVELMDPKRMGDSNAEPVRYLLGSAGKKITLFDPVTFAPLFTLGSVEVIPNEGGPKTPYLKVRSAGKEGLVDAAGKFVLAPNYNALYFWNDGYVRGEGPKGAGLWKDGRMLAEPQYADVGYEGSDLYTTLTKDAITYHSLSKGTSHTFRKGAQLLQGRYVLGQDPQTGLYGIAEIGGGTVVPFVYPGIYGPPAGLTLVRSDGKKGLIPSWAPNLPMEEPKVWFDTYTTLGGSYSFLSIQDGKKIGLYAETKGYLLEPQENTVVQYDQEKGRVIVRHADGTTTAYGDDGSEIKETAPQEQTLTDRLAVSGSKEQGFVLVDRESKQPIGSKTYGNIYKAEGGIPLIVAIDENAADLYTGDGELLTGELHIPAYRHYLDQSPVEFASAGGSLYTLGSKADAQGAALIRIADGQLQPVSDFAYGEMIVKSTAKQTLLLLTRPDGTHDVWTLADGQMARILEQVDEVVTAEGMDSFFVRKGAGWDLYRPEGQRLSSGSYKSLKYVNPGADQSGVIVCQDAATGLYGLMSTDGAILTAPKYENLLVSKEAFPQIWNEAGIQPPFLFTAKQQIGYLDANGQELFQTAYFTRKPAITYRPMTLQAMPAFADLLRQSPLELVTFDKPYSWSAGASSERQFFANLALFLGLPDQAGKEEVLAELVAKGIIKENKNRLAMSAEEMLFLLYYMERGQISHMTATEMWDWAGQQGLLSGKGEYDTEDIHTINQLLFARELLRTPAGKKSVVVKKLSAANLSPAQQQLLTSTILVDGKPLDQLPLPLPQEERAKAIAAAVEQYNKLAPQLLAAFLKQNP